MSKTAARSSRARRAWVHAAILLLCALFTTGGSFTCKGSTHDDDLPTTNRRKAQP